MVALLFLATVAKQAKLETKAQVYAALFAFAIVCIELLHMPKLSFSSPTDSIMRLLQWVQIVVLFVICVQIFQDRRAFSWILGAFFFSTLFVLICTLLEVPYFYASGFDRYGERIGYTGINLNRQGFLFSLIIIGISWRLIQRWPNFGKLEMLLGGIGCMYFYGLSLTGSRSSLIITCVGILYLVISNFNRRTFMGYVLFGFVFMPIDILIFLEAGVLFERVAGAVVEGHYSGREKYFWTSIDLWMQRPWLGYGTEFLNHLGVAQDRAVPRSTHNAVFQVLLAYGLIGFVFWVILINSLIMRVWKIRNRPIGNLLFALMLASVAYFPFADLAFNKHYWIVMAVVAAAPKSITLWESNGEKAFGTNRSPKRILASRRLTFTDSVG